MDTEKNTDIENSFDLGSEETFSTENTDAGAVLTRRERNAAAKKKKPSNDDEDSGGAYEWLQCLVAALLVCVIVFSFFFRIIGIIGSSMVPTFEDGDSVIISNILYTPAQGDVVVLRKDAFQDDPIIKRVIAVEGQTVSIDFDKGVVYVDDKALDEPYIAEPTYQSLDFSSEVLVPEGCVFVMGDNRNHSTDSRYSVIGCVDNRYIMGKVLLRILPINKFGAVN